MTGNEENGHGSSPIAVFDDVHCIVPRCRYEMKISLSSLHLRGKSFDDRISMSSIQQLFLLNQNDGLHIYFVVGLSSPIKRGKTEHHYLVFNFHREEKTQFVLDMDKEELQSLFKGRLKKEQSDLKYTVICNIIHVLSEFASARNILISKPSRFFSNYIDCFHAKQVGSLIFLSDGLIFLPNPPKYVSFQNIKDIFLGVAESSATKYFDLVIDTKTKERVVFTSIKKTIRPRLEIFANTFRIPIKPDSHSSRIIPKSNRDVVSAPISSKRAIFSGSNNSQAPASASSSRPTVRRRRRRLRTLPIYTEDSDEDVNHTTSELKSGSDTTDTDPGSGTDTDSGSGTDTGPGSGTETEPDTESDSEADERKGPLKRLRFAYLPFTASENYSLIYTPNAQAVVLMESLDSILKRSHSSLTKNPNISKRSKPSSSHHHDEDDVQTPLKKTIKLDERTNENPAGCQQRKHSQILKEPQPSKSLTSARKIDDKNADTKPDSAKHDGTPTKIGNKAKICNQLADMLLKKLKGAKGTPTTGTGQLGKDRAARPLPVLSKSLKSTFKSKSESESESVSDGETIKTVETGTDRGVRNVGDTMLNRSRNTFAWPPSDSRSLEIATKYVHSPAKKIPSLSLSVDPKQIFNVAHLIKNPPDKNLEVHKLSHKRVPVPIPVPRPVPAPATFEPHSSNSSSAAEGIRSHPNQNVSSNNSKSEGNSYAGIPYPAYTPSRGQLSPESDHFPPSNSSSGSTTPDQDQWLYEGPAHITSKWRWRTELNQLLHNSPERSPDPDPGPGPGPGPGPCTDPSPGTRKIQLSPIHSNKNHNNDWETETDESDKEYFYYRPS